jgi:hypothetical protein
MWMRTARELSRFTRRSWRSTTKRLEGLQRFLLILSVRFVLLFVTDSESLVCTTVVSAGAGHEEEFSWR